MVVRHRHASAMRCASAALSSANFIINVITRLDPKAGKITKRSPPQKRGIILSGALKWIRQDRGKLE